MLVSQLFLFKQAIVKVDTGGAPLQLQEHGFCGSGTVDSIFGVRMASCEGKDVLECIYAQLALVCV